MKALVIESAGHAAVKDVEEKPVRTDYIKIKVEAIALNPTDWKHLYNIAFPGAIIGCDVSGTVEEIGSAVKTAVKVGDRVAGICHGSNHSNPSDGGFAQHAQIKDGLWTQLPADWEHPAGATLGVAIMTIGQGLYQSLGLPPPDKPASKPFPLLVYGGSSAMGTMAIQWAKLSGLTVLTTASPQHHELLKQLGADACFDYNDADVGAKIRAYTNDELHYVFDTITEKGSMAISAAALTSHPTADAPAHYSSLLPPKGFPRDDCNTRYTMAYTAIGEAYIKGDRGSDAKVEDYAFARDFWPKAEKLLAQGKIKNHRIELRQGGLEAVPLGLDDLKAGKVRGSKLVYEMK